jgi:hypothetical protein
MQTILQIMFGDVPLHLQSCVVSVKNYARANKWGYIGIHSTDEYFKEPKFNSSLERFLWYRHASDWIRTRLLSEWPHLLYVDWDVFLYPDFKILEIEKMAFGKNRCVDAILYNGDQCNEFKKIHDQIELPNIHDSYNLSKVLRSYSLDHKVETFMGHYCHFDNCQFKDTLDYVAENR